MDVLGISIPVWGSLILVASLLYTFMMSRHFWTFKRMGVPGPTPRPILGNLVALVKQGIREFDRKGLQKYGKVFGYYDPLSMNLVVADKEMLREIFVKHFNNFSDRRTLDGFNGDLEAGLFNVKGDHWKHNRSIISPAFSSGKLRQMVPLIQEACNTLVKTARNVIKTGDNGQVEMRRLFSGYTMDVISSTAFGIQVDSQENPDDLYVMHAKKMFDVSQANPWMIIVLLFPMLQPLLLRLGFSLYPHDSMAYFRKLTTQLLEARRNREVGRKDFLQLMIDAQEGRLEKDPEDENAKELNVFNPDSVHKKGLTFDEILANAQLFFVAGYESTSIVLTMTAYNLATHPECQDKLRQEIQEKIGLGPIDSENIKKLQYLDMCINETLRMYPTAIRLNRLCVKTTKVKDITIPAGMVVTIPVYMLHHDPEVWEKPDVFNPERFSPSERVHHDPIDFLPFGYGPRNCIAMRLALMETKMATVDLVRKFRIGVGDKTDIPPKLVDKVVLKPLYMWLKLEEL
ncbi:cytochrome P450 3A8-like [Pecten maximus]|uniref:cytochrome P450 3A8-like n=1 Tax=Pecten maximus TaxID=6579 RepID=UPI001458DC46|nr:cytochrome P450 3A8-like [Pecten maximus]